MEFPYGRAALGILVLVFFSACGLLAMRENAPIERPDLIIETFTKEHAAAYRLVIPKFEAENHCKIQLTVVDQYALQSRLQSAMQVGADVPDIVELMDGYISFFTRGAVENVQLRDLTDKLKASGKYDQIVNARFSKWSSKGHIFALPHDVHPSVLAYRKDIVEQLGIDVSQLTTWDKFAEVGREVVAKSRDAHGQPQHYMFDMPTDGNDVLPMLALQRGSSMFSPDGDVTFDSPAYIDTVCWYVKQIQGPGRIAFPCGWGQNLAQAMDDGLVLFYMCPDWRTMQFEMNTPELAGKIGFIPLPAWEPGGLRTSTWGATGMAFPKASKHFDLAWKLAMYLYYDEKQLGPRFLATNILPPLKTAWSQPEFSQVDPYFGISLGKLFIPLAPQVPPSPINAYYYDAVMQISRAFTIASNYYAEHGEVGLHDVAEREMKASAEQVRKAMRRNVFLNPPGEPIRTEALAQ